MKFSKKILAAFLAALMAISMMPITVFATTYDSSKVVIDNLREGDIITTSVNKIIGLDEYSLTLQAGGYGSDGGNAENTDLRISWPEFSNGSVVDGAVGYYPFDENGNQSDTWYVVALDHGWDTITLSGIAPAPLTATFTGNLVDTFETGIMNKFIGGDVLDYDTTPVQKDRAYDISRGVDDYGLIVVVSVPGNAAFDPADISFTIGETVSRPVSDDDDDGSAAVWYDPYEDGDSKVYQFFVRKAAFTDSMVVDYTPSTPAEPAPTYTVTWENSDGTTLETDTDVAEGTVPTYDGATPAKASDLENSYTFSGWTPEVAAVTGDVTYTAQYTETRLPVIPISNEYSKFGDYTAYANKAININGVDDKYRLKVGNTNHVVDTFTPEDGYTISGYAYDNNVKYTFDGPGTVTVTGSSGNYTFTAKVHAVNENDSTDECVFYIGIPYTPEGEAAIGNVGYPTLEDAIAAAQTGDTVTLLQDVDFTVYPAFTRHTLDLTGVTLDLDGHEITTYNHSVVYVGDNFKIKNGTVTCLYDAATNKKESYAVVVYPQVGNWQTDVVTDKSTGVVLENLVLTGGINCFGSDVTVRGENTNVTGNYYYALWADVLSTLTVEDGTFTSAASSTNGIIGACSDAGKEAYVDISGGDYTVPAGKNLVLQSTMASSQQLVEISGGTYNVVVPAKACAVGFVPVTTPNAQGKYTVGIPDNGASITVAETISENFYLDDDFYGETAYVSFTYNHNSNVSEDADISTNVMAMASLDDATDGRKKFSVVQAPAQATEPIEIKVYANAADAQAGKNAIDTIDYSVYTYCRDIIENYDGEKATEMKALAKSTLDYAAAAQDYFDYNTENMATKDATGGFYNNVAGADLSTVAGVSVAPNCITKASVVVKSDLEINLFSLTPIEVTGASMDATKGKDRFAATSYQSGDYYVVHIAGIEPANMDNTITVNTSKGDIVMTANAIIKMMLNSNDAKLVTLAKAMYLYGAAANTYFD